MHLSPAEISLLIQERHAVQKELVKITFFDLLIRKVIALESPPEDAEALLVAAGEKWGIGPHKEHEQVLLQPLDALEGSPISVHDFFKAGIKQVRRKGNYLFHFVGKNPEVAQYLRNSFWDQLFWRIRFNEAGQVRSEQLKAQIEALDAQFTKAYQKRSQEMYAMVSQLGGYLLLLPSFEPGMLQHIDRKLMEAYLLKKQDKRENDGAEEADFDHAALMYWQTDSMIDVMGIFMLMDFGEIDRMSGDDFFDALDSAIDGGIDAGGDGGGDGGDGGGCSGCGGCGG